MTLRKAVEPRFFDAEHIYANWPDAELESRWQAGRTARRADEGVAARIGMHEI